MLKAISTHSADYVLIVLVKVHTKTLHLQQLVNQII